MADKASEAMQHGVPIFWPLAMAWQAGMEEASLFAKNIRFLLEAEKLDHGLAPDFASENQVLLDLHTMRLRDFGTKDEKAIPTLVVAPYAGHTATIADYRPGQSLVETLRAAGLGRVLVTDWKSATHFMKDYDIDTYLAELLVAVEDLGGRVHLVGLCQGGWMSAMFASRFPRRVASLVLAGSPIDTQAGDGPLKAMVQELPESFYEDLVAAGNGIMRGRLMLEGWKNMHPDKQYVDKYLELYRHLDEPDYVAKVEAFSAWYENPLDLPGRWYLQSIGQLFKENRFAKGQFVGLGRTLSLSALHCPLYLLAGAEDDITPKEQVFAAAQLASTAEADKTCRVVPGGHIGLFMGSRTLADGWPEIGRWLAALGG